MSIKGIKEKLYLILRKYAKIKKNRMVFTSFSGHYSDSPKYISEKIHEIAPEYELVWLVKDKYLEDLPEYVRGVDIDSREALDMLATARAHIDNVYGMRSYVVNTANIFKRMAAFIYAALIKKPGQSLFTTWHGTPLKRMSRDVKGNQDRNLYCANTTMLLGNRHTLEVMDRLTYGKFTMEAPGMARNSILFASDKERAEIKKRLGLPEDKKIVIYAPTFRSDGVTTDNKNVLRSGVNQMKDMDIPKLLSALSLRFGGDFALVCRFHYHVEAMVDFDSLERAYPGRIINGNAHDDMAEYLAVSDVLITDASSSMFDFALTARPCFILFPDLDFYEGKERGFYMPLDTLPFPWSRDVLKMIENIEGFNREAYAEGVKKMLSDIGNKDDENSAKRCAEYIISRCPIK